MDTRVKPAYDESEIEAAVSGRQLRLPPFRLRRRFLTLAAIKGLRQTSCAMSLI
jgi:hypothetical protein